MPATSTQRLARPPTSSSDSARRGRSRRRPVATISSALTARIWAEQSGSRRCASCTLGSRPHIGRCGRSRYSWCSKRTPAGTMSRPGTGIVRARQPVDLAPRRAPAWTVTSTFSSAFRVALHFLKCRIPTDVQVISADEPLRREYIRQIKAADRRGRPLRGQRARSARRRRRSSTCARATSSTPGTSRAPSTSRAATSSRGSTAPCPTAASA